MEKTDAQKIRLGLFIIIGSIFFLTAIYFVGNKQNMFGNTSILKAVFENVSGLQVGNNVRYAGIDIGLINDASVLCILDKNGNLVNYYRFDKVESPDLIQEIVNLNNIWKFKMIYIENNNGDIIMN